MLTNQEVEQMRQNAKVHRKIFSEIRKMAKEWMTAYLVNEMCGKIAKQAWVLCWFKGVYWFPDNICISINDVVVHGRIRPDMEFKKWDLVTFDFWIKDKNFKINTDAAISIIIGWDETNPEWARMIEANKKALYAGIKVARAWNTIWDIGAAIQKEIEKAGFHVVRDLTWHAIGKKLHEKPYIYNYGKPWTGPKLKKWMTLAIEPILWQTNGEIIEKWDWEIYIKDGSLGSQYEHTILITDWEAEIII